MKALTHRASRVPFVGLSSWLRVSIFYFCVFSDMAAEQVASHRASSLSLSRSQQVDGTLSPAATWAITAIIVFGLAYYHWRYEGWFETIAFAGSVTAALFFALL